MQDGAPGEAGAPTCKLEQVDGTIIKHTITPPSACVLLAELQPTACRSSAHRCAMLLPECLAKEGGEDRRASDLLLELARGWRPRSRGAA